MAGRLWPRSKTPGPTRARPGPPPDMCRGKLAFIASSSSSKLTNKQTNKQPTTKQQNLIPSIVFRNVPEGTSFHLQHHIATIQLVSGEVIYRHVLGGTGFHSLLLHLLQSTPHQHKSIGQWRGDLKSWVAQIYKSTDKEEILKNMQLS